MQPGIHESRVPGPFARGLLIVIALTVSLQAARALLTSATVGIRAASLPSETLEQAQDRLFGEEYMASIRRVRSLVDESATIFLIDGQSSERGANYFLVYFLAPRKLVRIGSTRKNSPARLARNIPSGDHWLLVSRDFPEAAEIWKAEQYKGQLRRARQSPD